MNILRCTKCSKEYTVPSHVKSARCPCGCEAVIYKRGKPVVRKGKRKG